MVLSAGIHSFPFKLGLPLGLPSTFLGKHGWVQFFCKAAIKENGGLVHKNQQVFIVMNPIDLNVEPPVLAVSPIYNDIPICFVHFMALRLVSLIGFMGVSKDQMSSFVKGKWEIMVTGCEIRVSRQRDCLCEGEFTVTVFTVTAR